MKEMLNKYYFREGKRYLVAVKHEGKIILTVDGYEVREADINSELESLVIKILNASKKLNAVIFYDDLFLGELVKLGAPVPTILDDLCQIAGAGVKCCKTLDYQDIKKQMFMRNAVILKGKGALCFGRTLDEANTCCLVLEKGAKSFIEGVILGGVRPINIIESMLMHVIYTLKYSHKDQSKKLKEMEGGVK